MCRAIHDPTGIPDESRDLDDAQLAACIPATVYFDDQIIIADDRTGLIQSFANWKTTLASAPADFERRIVMDDELALFEVAGFQSIEQFLGVSEALDQAGSPRLSLGQDWERQRTRIWRRQLHSDVGTQT